MEATLVESCPPDSQLYREEAFGPAVILSKFSDWDDALREVNDSKFGLQAGIFTRDLHKMMKAWDKLDVGGVVVNDVPSSGIYALWRSKGLGIGRRYPICHGRHERNSQLLSVENKAAYGSRRCPANDFGNDPNS